MHCDDIGEPKKWNNFVSNHNKEDGNEDRKHQNNHSEREETEAQLRVGIWSCSILEYYTGSPGNSNSPVPKFRT